MVQRKYKIWMNGIVLEIGNAIHAKKGIVAR
jgi:hypothetical protein